MGEKINISILGSCVSRDTIEYNIDKYNVQRFVNFVSFYTMLNGTPIDLPLEKLNKSGIPPFRLRCAWLDASKNVINYFAEVKSDWLLLDFTSLRSSVIRYKNKNVLLTNSYDVYTSKFVGVLNELLGEEHETVYMWNVSEEEILLRTRNVIKEMLNQYSADRIILHEAYGVLDYISADGQLKKQTSDYAKSFSFTNPLIKKAIEYCPDLLEGCHIIRMPDNAVCDEKSKWGLNPLHYHALYYEYAEKAVQIITKRSGRKKETEELENLRNIYSEKFTSLKAQTCFLSEKLQKEKWQGYAMLFKKLICDKFLCYDNNGLNNLEQAFIQNGHKRIALYGDTVITDVLVSVLKGTSIKIDYIVANKDRDDGIKTVKWNEDFDNVDIMLVCYIYGYEETIQKLIKKKLPFKFCSAADYINRLKL